MTGDLRFKLVFNTRDFIKAQLDSAWLGSLAQSQDAPRQAGYTARLNMILCQ
jgi:hypothetical protein